MLLKNTHPELLADVHLYLAENGDVDLGPTRTSAQALVAIAPIARNVDLLVRLNWMLTAASVARQAREVGDPKEILLSAELLYESAGILDPEDALYALLALSDVATELQDFERSFAYLDYAQLIDQRHKILAGRQELALPLRMWAVNVGYAPFAGAEREAVVTRATDLLEQLIQSSAVTESSAVPWRRWIALLLDRAPRSAGALALEQLDRETFDLSSKADCDSLENLLDVAHVLANSPQHLDLALMIANELRTLLTRSEQSSPKLQADVFVLLAGISAGRGDLRRANELERAAYQLYGRADSSVQQRCCTLRRVPILRILGLYSEAEQMLAETEELDRAADEDPQTVALLTSMVREARLSNAIEFGDLTLAQRLREQVAKKREPKSEFDETVYYRSKLTLDKAGEDPDCQGHRDLQSAFEHTLDSTGSRSWETISETLRLSSIARDLAAHAESEEVAGLLLDFGESTVLKLLRDMTGHWHPNHPVRVSLLLELAALEEQRNPDNPSSGSRMIADALQILNRGQAGDSVLAADVGLAAARQNLRLGKLAEGMRELLHAEQIYDRFLESRLCHRYIGLLGVRADLLARQGRTAAAARVRAELQELTGGSEGEMESF